MNVIRILGSNIRNMLDSYGKTFVFRVSTQLCQHGTAGFDDSCEGNRMAVTGVTAELIPAVGLIKKYSVRSDFSCQIDEFFQYAEEFP